MECVYTYICVQACLGGGAVQENCLHWHSAVPRINDGVTDRLTEISHADVGRLRKSDRKGQGERGAERDFRGFWTRKTCRVGYAN